MKGLQLLLQSFGIKIEPSEIEAAWARGKDALPKIAQEFAEIKETQQRIEAKLDSLITASDDSPEVLERIKQARNEHLLNGKAAGRA